MRVKFKETKDVPKLEFGKTYDIKFWGCSFIWRFTFTRRNYVLVTEINQWNEINYSYKMSKRELKQLINDSNVTHFIAEIQK